jgi:magnesium-transporting ATPase (P-type)
MTPAISANNGRGLSTAEARARLKQFGPNAVVEEKAHPFKEFIKRF